MTQKSYPVFIFCLIATALNLHFVPLDQKTKQCSTMISGSAERTSEKIKAVKPGQAAGAGTTWQCLLSRYLNETTLNNK